MSQHLCRETLLNITVLVVLQLLPPANVVCEGYVLTSVCLSTGGGCVYPSMHCRPTPRGKVEGSGLGGLQVHTWGGLQAHTWGGLQAHTQVGLQAHTQEDSRHTRGGSPGHTVGGGVSRPTQWGLLLQVVRILLECILVNPDTFLYIVAQPITSQTGVIISGCVKLRINNKRQVFAVSNPFIS